MHAYGFTIRAQSLVFQGSAHAPCATCDRSLGRQNRQRRNKTNDRRRESERYQDLYSGLIRICIWVCRPAPAVNGNLCMARLGDLSGQVVTALAKIAAPPHTQHQANMSKAIVDIGWAASWQGCRAALDVTAAAGPGSCLARRIGSR